MWKFGFSKFGILAVVCAVLCASAALFYIFRAFPQSQPGLNPQMLPVQTAAGSAAIAGRSDNSIPEPQVFSLKVPFTAQAPTGNWDALHEEACEETAAIMVNAYFAGNTAATLTPDYTEQQLATLVSWEQQNFGFDTDTTSEQTAAMIHAVYGLNTKLVNDFSADDLKRELLAGNAVIISEAGRLLGNPNYKSPGPVHHMLVIRGYTPEGFITNDSGTRRGENYFYTFETIKNAAADWNAAASNVDQGKKIAIVVSK